MCTIHLIFGKVLRSTEAVGGCKQVQWASRQGLHSWPARHAWRINASRLPHHTPRTHAPVPLIVRAHTRAHMHTLFTPLTPSPPPSTTTNTNRR